MEATLNVRMDATLKERGDRVLRKNGISASAAIRALWQHMASTREVPDFVQAAHEQTAANKRKLLALDELSGIAQGALFLMSDEELETLGNARYQ